MAIEVRGILWHKQTISVDSKGTALDTQRIFIKYEHSGLRIVLEMSADQAMTLIRDIKTDILGTDYIVRGKHSKKHCKNCDHVRGEFCNLFWYEPIYRGDKVGPGAIDTCRHWRQKKKKELKHP